MVSGPDDPTADAVVDELVMLGTPTVRIDIGDFPVRMTMTAQLVTGIWRTTLSDVNLTVDMADVKSVYYRRPTRFTFHEGMSDGDLIFASAEAQFGLGGMPETLDALWVNNPTRIAFAEYKPVQLRVAGDSGLSVPRTLVTNSHKAAREFAATVGGPIVCKTLSSLVLSENAQPRITYTTPINPANVDLDSLAATAHLLQEQVSKAF